MLLKRTFGEGYIKVTYDEIFKMLKELDVNKSIGLEGVPNWILQKCKEQLADKIHSMMMASLL